MPSSAFDLTSASSGSERLSVLQRWGILRIEAYLNEATVKALAEEQRHLTSPRLTVASGEDLLPKSEAVFRGQWMRDLAHEYLVQPHSFNEQIELVRTSKLIQDYVFLRFGYPPPKPVLFFAHGRAWENGTYLSLEESLHMAEMGHDAGGTPNPRPHQSAQSEHARAD